MRIFRNLARRKLRTTLTVVGITIGIWALVVMSSMANKISALVDGGSTYYGDKIVVSDATNLAFGFGIAPIPVSTAREIEAIQGVDVTVPEVTLLLDPDAAAGGFGLPDLIAASTPGADKGRALRLVCEQLGVPLEEAMAVGDAAPDVAMFDVAKVGVAMGNAPEDVQAQADAVAPSNLEGGVAWAIRRFVLGE